MEYRIYVKDRLVNICGSFALVSIVTYYDKEYGEDNVEIKHVKRIMDDERREWLNHMMDGMQLD